ncbi:hypothetical protein [Amycolatopsis sp. DSM 110486]|uniref:hypothetical protein n=1 Tax=Amycolatopsis sp. DSM 110486 TaxID=2865832 RepID=UPI001C699767|nr:hypothetical protein [Amycolatopsis sp. DSM 110486]QYN17511.1 hypothetical protein K1T34_32515 [Amycolatopsis sp. DSM 110486]
MSDTTARNRDLDPPNSCADCGIEQQSHFTRVTRTGLHTWIEPSNEQRKRRMLARRAARSVS